MEICGLILGEVDAHGRAAEASFGRRLADNDLVELVVEHAEEVCDASPGAVQVERRLEIEDVTPATRRGNAGKGGRSAAGDPLRPCGGRASADNLRLHRFELSRPRAAIVAEDEPCAGRGKNSQRANARSPCERTSTHATKYLGRPPWAFLGRSSRASADGRRPDRRSAPPRWDRRLARTCLCGHQRPPPQRLGRADPRGIGSAGGRERLPERATGVVSPGQLRLHRGWVPF